MISASEELTVTLSSSGEWWSSLSPSDMIRYVQVWKTALSWIPIFKSVSCDAQARNVLLILQHMYYVSITNYQNLIKCITAQLFNKKKLDFHTASITNTTTSCFKTNEINKKIPETTFCLELRQMFLKEDLKRWRTKSKLKVRSADNKYFEPAKMAVNPENDSFMLTHC